jgi:hypothetical protein
MNYLRPEGCKAAVTSDWEFSGGSYRLTARMVCGERNNVANGSFQRGFLDLDTERQQGITENRVGEDVSEILGAMCLGCAHKEVISETSVEIDTP